MVCIVAQSPQQLELQDPYLPWYLCSTGPVCHMLSVVCMQGKRAECVQDILFITYLNKSNSRIPSMNLFLCVYIFQLLSEGHPQKWQAFLWQESPQALNISQCPLIRLSDKRHACHTLLHALACVIFSLSRAFRYISSIENSALKKNQTKNKPPPPNFYKSKLRTDVAEQYFLTQE